VTQAVEHLLYKHKALSSNPTKETNKLYFSGHCGSQCNPRWDQENCGSRPAPGK
jgi:hypothetical protein